MGSVISVAKVETGNVHTGVDKSRESLHGPASGSKGTDDFCLAHGALQGARITEYERGMFICMGMAIQSQDEKGENDVSEILPAMTRHLRGHIIQFALAEKLNLFQRN